jgi:hypothetical protein
MRWRGGAGGGQGLCLAPGGALAHRVENLNDETSRQYGDQAVLGPEVLMKERRRR